MRSAPLVVVRRPKRPQPANDISDSRIPHLRILSILCQHFVAFDHRDQKAGSLFRNQVAADGPLRLSPPQSHDNALLPAVEDPLQSLAESFVEMRHLLRQIDQGTTALYVSWPSWYRPYNADQSIDGVLVVAPLQRKYPPVTGECCDNLFDNGVSQSILALEMVVKCSFGHVGGGQDRIDAGALESRSVDLPKTRLQQAFPRALRITGPPLLVRTS